MKRVRTHYTIEDVLVDRVESDYLLEVPLENRIFKTLMILVLVCGGIIIWKVVHIGVVDQALYEKRALANITIPKVQPAPRGIIEDRFGNPLVRNEPSFNAFLIPHELPKERKERREMLSKISSILKINETDVLEKIEKKDWSLSDRLLLVNDLKHDELVDLSTVAIPGLKIEPSFKRLHEESRVFSHVLGYTGIVNADDLKKNPNLIIDDEIGRSGLEAWYDGLLRGINGRELLFRNSQGKIEESQVVQLPKEGKTLRTYLDKELQEYVYEALSNKLKALNRDVGVAVVMNPQNGEVLSLVGIPGYDTTQLTTHLKEKNQPLFNRAVSGLYNPGSTIKPLVAVAALEENVVTPQKEVYSPGYIEVPNPYRPEEPTRFFDWKPQGWVNVRSALAKSSNVYFYEVGGGFADVRGLGIGRLNKWWQIFNLNSETGIDLPGEEHGFLPTPDWKKKTKKEEWRLGDTYNVSIGQGDLLITPLELLNYINAIANGGKVYAPRVAQSEAPKLVKDISKEIGGKPLEVVREGMKDAVRESYGTAHILASLPMSVAGKTGSAQVANNTKVNAFVVAFAPAENPEISIVILIENALEGSLNVVPIAHDVLLWYYNNRIKNNRLAPL